MEERPTVRIGRVFGWPGFPDGLFFEAEHALRFELGGELPMGPVRFLQAIDRARAIAGAAFANSKRLTAVLKYAEEDNSFGKNDRLSRKLRKFGFTHTFGPPERIRVDDQEYVEQFGVGLNSCWSQVEFPNEKSEIASLLWSSISSEMPISPRIPWFAGCIYIVDFDAGLALWVYDDRGMDVVATSLKLLAPLYEQFHDWLLSDERMAMANKFPQT